MSWYNAGGDWNPINWDKKDWRDAAVGAGAGFFVGGPVGAVVGGYGGGSQGENVGNKIKGYAGDVKDAFDAPYEMKAKGYDAIRAETDRLKQERMGQKKYAYDLADSKYAPTRAAIAKVYGDPSGWKL